MASSGGLVSYFLPHLTSSGSSSIYSESTSNEKTFEFEKLNRSSEEDLKKLSELLSQFKLSREFAKSSKDKKLQEAIKTLQEISTNEESLKALYSIIEDKLKTLQAESQKLNQKVTQRLTLDSKFAQLKTSQSYLTQLTSLLFKWETSINNIVCAFQQNQAEGKGTSSVSCNTKNSTLLNTSTSSGGGEDQASSSSGTQSQTQTEGDRAKEKLEEAKKAFEKLQKSISEASIGIQSESMRTIWEELSLYPDWIKLHGEITLIESHIQLINRTIRRTNTEASSKVEELNRKNSDLRETYESYNSWKNWQSTFHKYLEIFEKEKLRKESDSLRQMLNISKQEKIKQ